MNEPNLIANENKKIHKQITTLKERNGELTQVTSVHSLDCILSA